MIARRFQVLLPRIRPYLTNNYACYYTTDRDSELSRLRRERGNPYSQRRNQVRQRAQAPTLYAANEAPVPNFGPVPTLKDILSQPQLVIARQMEILNLTFGYDQANKYAKYIQFIKALGYIVEKDTFGGSLARQVLGRHRPFEAYVLDLNSNTLMTVKRGFTFIQTKLNVFENDQLVGEVHQRWHPLRRKYDLFIQKKQFADIDEPLLSWDFNIKGEHGGNLALVTKNWTGIAQEIFTDAGRYQVLFEDSSLTFDEKIITLGCAVAIDLDYFTRTSRNSGLPLLGLWGIFGSRDE